MIVTGNRNVIRQLRVTGATEIIGENNVYRSTTFLGESTRQAYSDATAWVEEQAAVGAAVDDSEPSDDENRTGDD